MKIGLIERMYPYYKYPLRFFVQRYRVRSGLELVQIVRPRLYHGVSPLSGLELVNMRIVALMFQSPHVHRLLHSQPQPRTIA